MTSSSHSERALKFRNSMDSHAANALNFLITFHGISFACFISLYQKKKKKRNKGKLQK